MSAKLVFVGGDREGEEIELPDGGKISLGRGDTVDVRLQDATVSRTHCFLEFTGGKAALKDNGSTGGTRVNGKAITAHVLRPGETITIGTFKLRYQVGAFNVEEDDGPEELVPAELKKLQGSKLGHYDLGEVLGIGKSGVVFKARDHNDGKEVALKVYLPDFAKNEEDLQRFVRAVKTMLPLRHPHLVTLHGGGKTGPYCWMAMEHVEGESLTNTIARIGRGGKLDWRPALGMANSITSGLYYLHSEKIVHRNLSPGNVLLSRLGVAKLASLILAKALSGALAQDVTKGDEFLGDVRYQAPEQVGAGGTVDGRADIYSLGALLYALLTAKPPFEGKTPLETATMILEAAPSPPRKVNPQIPPQFEKIVLQMLAKKPQERFASTADLLAELEALPKF